MIATQTKTTSTESVSWRHVDASGASVRATDTAGQSTIGLAELDAMGANAGAAKPLVWNPPNKEGKLLPYLGFEDINSPGGGCELDRMPIPCDRLQTMMGNGAVSMQVTSGTRTAAFDILGMGLGIYLLHQTSHVNNRVIGADNGEASTGETTDYLDYTWIPDLGANAHGPQERELSHAPQKDGYPGGSPNPKAQLGPCLELIVPEFDELNRVNHAALTLLINTFASPSGGPKSARHSYDAMSTYEKAVFLNTAAAAASVGVNLSNAKFADFYRSDKPGSLPYGIYARGISGVTSGRHRGNGSVEIDSDDKGIHIDVDLYNPFGGPILFYKHNRVEIPFNDKWQRPTHPGDVIQQLQVGNTVDTGVSCKN